MSLEHWMMFSTFAEQDYFIYPRQDACNCVVINANMAAHAPAGLANFVVGKLSDHKYIVDPITHAFQHDPAFIKDSKGAVKKSIGLLASIYGDPIATKAGTAPLLPSDLTDPLVDSLSARVLDFQRNHLCSYMKSSDAAKYLEEQDIKSPHALVAPYFYMMETDFDSWLPINLQLLAKSGTLKQSASERIFAEIVIDRGVLLNPNASTQIIEGYRQHAESLSGILLWVDNFDEQEVSMAELRAFKEFCTALKSFSPEVINLHGGYFSIMLGGVVGGTCLTGVTHGPEFGEYRSVVPVGGGIPIARYYIPKLHSRIRYREAVQIFTAAGWLDSATTFHGSVCDCEECRTTIDGDPGRFTLFGEGEVKDVRRGKGMVRIEFPFSATKLRCLRHYLQRKHREYQMIRIAEPGVSIEELKNSIAVHRPYVGDGGIAHLLRWQKVLSND